MPSRQVERNQRTSERKTSGSGGIPTVYLAHDEKQFTLTAPDKLIVVENWFEELKPKARK